MLDFSSCKLNIGLNVVKKRGDGFHNIETAFYPINWLDAIEIIEDTGNQEFKISFSGLTIEGPVENNIVYKAYHLIRRDFKLPSIKVHLHKNIPMGAGLGGGSSNGAKFINLIDKNFNLKIPVSLKTEIAKQLGSDCSFFIENKPVFASDKGDAFEPLKLDLNDYYILVVYPNIISNTKIAYDNVIPKPAQISIKTIIETKPIQEWRNLLVNDFEASVFKKHPEIANLKQQLYNSGAIYASMSGSGSAVFGIFEEKPLTEFKKDYRFFLQEPSIVANAIIA